MLILDPFHRLQRAVLSEHGGLADRRRCRPSSCPIAPFSGWRRPGDGSIWLLRVVAGIDCRDPRARKIPPGPLLVAAKHQSAWETFALLPLFVDPAFIIKRELQWVPIFGWYTIKGRMVPVDRGAGAQALDRHGRARPHRARPRPPAHHLSRRHAAAGRRRAALQIRRRPSLCRRAACPACRSRSIPGCSGRAARLRMRRAPCVVEILDPIAPGLDKEVFFERLQDEIETRRPRG